MIKYGLRYTMVCESKDELLEAIGILFDKMLEFRKVPSNFNTIILKPLVKDNNKPTNTTKNLRPIASADAITNIFLRYLQVIIEESSPNHQKQFGFKKKSSRGHAVFCLKQLVKFCKTQLKSLLCVS